MRKKKAIAMNGVQIMRAAIEFNPAKAYTFFTQHKAE